MDLDIALAWVADRKHGVLVTIRRDGRPQTSDIVYACFGDGGVRVSVTDDRAKTKNLERDPRAVLHVTDADAWSYVSLDGIVDLSPVAAEPGDATCLELAEVYRHAAGEDHPDWADYDRAMIADRRRVARFTPATATGIVR